MTTDARMINHLWTHKTQDHPFLSDEELVIDRAEGVWVWTEQGKKLLDEKQPSNTLMKRWAESAGKA